MAPAAPAIGAGVAAGAGAAASGVVITGFVALDIALVIAASAALSLAAAELTPTPSIAKQKRTSMIKQAVTDRRMPFGDMVVSGPLTFYETTSGGHRFHHMIVTLGDAPEAWDGIPIVWIDDTPVFEEEIDANGNVIAGKFAPDLPLDASPPGVPNMRIKKHLGGPGQVADPDLLADIPHLDANFKGEGVAYVYVKFNWKLDEFPSGLPNIKVWARTNSCFDTRDSTRRYTPNAALVLREYLTQADNGLGFDAADIDDTQTNAAANVCDEIVDANPVGHAVVLVDTANDELDLAVEGNAAPLRLETGDRVEVFTDGTAPGGLATSTSYYVIVERLVGALIEDNNKVTIPLSAGDYTGAAATAITNGDVDASYHNSDGIHAAVKLATTYANALARTSIPITSIGTGQHLIIKTGEPRYAAVGLAETAASPQNTIEDILSSMAGRLIWTGGEFKIVPAAWSTPITPAFDESDLMGPLVVRTRHSRRDRFNSVRGIFATQLAVGEPTDYPPIIDSTYIADDGGFNIWATVDRPWTSRAATAQRLGKIDLARHRREIRVEFPTGPQGFRAIPGSVVQISNTRRGWTNKTFEVTAQEDLEITPENDGEPFQGVKLSLAELDSTAFDFVASSDETVKPPQGSPPGDSPFNIDAPTGLTMTSGDSELFLKADGTVVSRIKVEWTTEDAFSAQTEVQFKQTAASVWDAGGLVHVDQSSTHIWDVEDGISYDVRVRSISNLGVLSDWTTGTHTVTGKTAAPPDVDTFNVTRMADGTRRFSWTATPPADVRTGGGFKIKQVGGTGGVWSGMTEIHTGLLPASPFETNELAAGTYTFGIKMVDSSGNESANAQIIEATLGDPRLRDVIVSRDEFVEGWPGTKVDCFVNYEGILESTSSQAWSDLPGAWSSLPDSWLTILNSNSPITYTTPTIDLGADVTFTPIVSVDPSTNATVTMQTGTDADGAPVGAFVSLDTVTARYIKIKVSEASTDPFIQAMSILLDSETQIEDYEDVDTSAASSGVFERIATGHFKLETRGNTSSITSATIRAFQNAGSGWTWDLISKATTITAGTEPAAEFKIYQNGTLTDATIDAEIRGPKK